MTTHPNEINQARRERRRLTASHSRSGFTYDVHGWRVVPHPGLMQGAFGHAKPMDYERLAKGTRGAGTRAHLVVTEQ